ncbi:MAG TPA: hypothetical protein PKV86_10815, partial [Syntrophobacteraceae bacterium]|nr:hypothetical protein [Syntrophobacteraceae bacterium]
ILIIKMPKRHHFTGGAVNTVAVRQSMPRLCPCGCGQSLLFSFHGPFVPPQGAMLYYRCPQSTDLLSFRENGAWEALETLPVHRLVAVSLDSQS